MKATVIPILAGMGALLLVLGASPPSVSTSVATFQRSRMKIMDLASRVIDYVARGESGGAYWAQNRNSDGQGLSFGLIQWTQKSGSLGRLLRAMRAVDAAAFDRIFAPDAGTLLAVTTSNSETVRLSLPLWQEPWTARFKAAGQHRPFQEVQAYAARTGAGWKAALEIAGIFGVQTERALVLFFDRANHQGHNGAPKVARDLKAELLAQGLNTVPYMDLLRAYAVRCSASYHRHSVPNSFVTDSGKVWKQVGSEWHLFAGSADLYTIIVRRTGAILSDPSLSDVALELIA